MKIGKKIIKALESAGFGIIDFTDPKKPCVDSDRAEEVIAHVIEQGEAHKRLRKLREEQIAVEEEKIRKAQEIIDTYGRQERGIKRKICVDARDEIWRAHNQINILRQCDEVERDQQ